MKDMAVSMRIDLQPTPLMGETGMVFVYVTLKIMQTFDGNVVEINVHDQLVGECTLNDVSKTAVAGARRILAELQPSKLSDLPDLKEM